MFGLPCIPPPGAAIFHWVWTYKIKEEDNHYKKACAVCDGSTRGGHAQIIVQTYAPTPHMTNLRLFFALAALENKLVFGADVSNTFAEAHAPAQVYFMQIDVQFVNGGPEKVNFPFLKDMLFLFSKIYKDIQKHLVNSLSILVPYCNNFILSPLCMLLAYIVLLLLMKMFFFFVKLMILQLLLAMRNFTQTYVIPLMLPLLYQ